MAERTIAHVYFRYRAPLLVDGVAQVNDKGDPLYVEKFARTGETIDDSQLLPDDLARAETYGAFAADGAPAAASMSAAELRRWLRDDAPTVEQVLAAVGDDPKLAARVLKAEEQVSEDGPRATLQAGLERIIASGDEGGQ